jgi:hypothetical protein
LVSGIQDKKRTVVGFAINQALVSELILLQVQDK